MDNNMPQCVGFIMDGNRRWAKEQGKESLEGHAQGFLLFQDVVRWVADAGIPHAVFYAFSTENWKRSETEVGYLMVLFEKSLRDLKEKAEADSLKSEKKVRVRIVGRRSDFSLALQDLMNELEEKTKEYTDAVIWIALSYGGRAELVTAVNAAIEKGEPVDEDSFRAFLWSAELPDVDLLIRTSGEQRISNFLPWQLSYAELHFSDTYWPAFTKDEFNSILQAYALRERRRGA